MPRKKIHRRRGPGSPAVQRDRPSSSSRLMPRHGAYEDKTLQDDVESVKLGQLQEMFKDSITAEVVQLLYLDNDGKVEPTLDALIAMADPVRPSLVSRIKEDGMEYPDDPFMSAFSNTTMTAVGSVGNNKPVGFERSKFVNEVVATTRVNVPPLFASLPHSDYDGSGMRHERSESVDCVPLLTPVDFPGFIYPSGDVQHPLLSSSGMESTQIRQTIIEEVNETPEQFRQLISKPINIPQIPHMDTYHTEKQPNLSPKSPKSPKMEQNLSRSPKSAPRSPKGQPRSPHQTKADSKNTGKKKNFEKYQVPPRLKKKAKSHEITCIDRLQPEKHAEQRRKSLPATLYNPILTAVKERANYFPAVDCENFSLDVPDNVNVIPEEDEDKHSDGAGAATEAADMDDLLSEIHSTTNTNDNDDDEEEDDVDSNCASKRSLSVEDHKKSNFGKRVDDEKVEMPKQTSKTFNGMQEEALQEARMSLSQLNVGAKEFVPRTTTTPEPKIDDSECIAGELDGPKPMIQERVNMTAIRKVVPYMMPTVGGKLAFQQPNGHDPGKYVFVSPVPYMIYQTLPVVGRQSPEHYLQSNATPPNSRLGSPVISRRQVPGSQGKKKKKKNKSKNKKESEPKCQSSKESIDDESDKILLSDNPSKTSPMKEEALVPKPVITEVPVWPKIRSTNYKTLKKPDASSSEEPEPLPDGKVLCLMRGLPGSGKTTLARKLQKEGGIFSTDDYFINRNGEYEYRRDHLTKAHDWNHKKVLEALEKGMNPIIVDNTNLEKWVMKPYILMAKRMKYAVVIREPDTPWKLNPNQLAKRCTHGVSKDKITSLLDNFEPNMTVEKVIGYSTDWKNSKGNSTENTVQDPTKTIIAQNKFNTEQRKYDQSEKNKCVATEHDQIRNGDKLDNDATTSKTVEQKGQRSKETAQQHLKSIRKLGNVASPNIPTPSNNSSTTVTLAPSCLDSTENHSDLLLEKDSETDWCWSEVKRKQNSSEHDSRPHQKRDSETNRRSGISNKKRIHSLIKEGKVEISDDDEIDINIHGGVFDMETDTHSDNSKLVSNRSDAAVNVNAKDLALLQRIEAGLQNMKSLENGSILTGVGSNFISSDCHITETVIPLIATLDKGSMTLEADNNYKDELLVFLGCFPTVPKEDLLHVLKQCNNDTQWASGILLDSNLYQPTKSPLQRTLLDSCDSIKEAPDEHAIALQDLETTSTSNTSLDPPSTAFESQDQVNAKLDLDVNVVDDHIILKLDAKFGSQLQERFGRYDSHIDLDLVSQEDLQVAVPYDLAFVIYETWQETLKKRRMAENRAVNIGNLKADEDLAKKLQQEEDYRHMKEIQEAKLSSWKHQPRMRSGHRSDMLRIMPDGRADYGPVLNQGSEVGLREIMDQELNLQLVNDLEFEPLADEPSTAAKIKRHMLFKRFPKIDKNDLEKMFSANQYHLSNTIRNVESSYNLHPMPVHIVLSDKTRDELEKRLVLQADEDSQTATSDAIPIDSNEELDIECPDDAEYVDYRVNAVMHKQLQAECLHKASEAYRKGQKQLATYYAEKGREYRQKIREANQEASKRIHQKLNRDYLKSNILDLHLYHVDEAINELEDALNKMKQELKGMQQKPKTLYLSVIMGRGKNSPQGIARIRQAVREHLERHKYQFSESTPGLIKVSLKPDC